MNTMNYKGYVARIEYDERDDILVGRVLGIKTILSFHAADVAGFRAEFEVAINDYLSDCQQRHEAPEKPASGRLMLRIAPELHARALLMAEASGLSLNKWTEGVIRSAT